MFGRYFKNIYDVNNIFDRKNIDDNDVNIIAEFKLLYDILNKYKHAKNNYRYSPIVHEFMNTPRSKKKKNF